MPMKTRTVEELRGMVAEGCQGHTEANAALAELARRAEAAPDLLAALRMALEESGCDGDLCAHQWHDAARAAIAKGRTQR